MIFENWLGLIGQIQDASGQTDEIVCPSCGKSGCIDFQYVGSPETRIGYLAVWCEECNYGIQTSRARAPDEFDLLPFGSPADVIKKRIPNFERVEPVSIGDK